jgi:hypothetical protein
MERMMEILKWIGRLGQAWIRFWALTFCMIILLPLMYVGVLLMIYVPFYFLGMLQEASTGEFWFLLFAATVALVLVLVELFGPGFSFVRGRKIRSEKDAVKESAKNDRPASMIRRRR